jgi:DNA-binding transcriptional ArsR family regulator
VRRIAANLGISKDTVTQHLATLREFGFVLREEVRDEASGRYELTRYVLGPSACIEDVATPRPKGWDTVTVSHVTGQRELPRGR